MAQQPTELTPLASPQHFLGAELRHWRHRRGLTLTQLGQAVHASGDWIAKIEKARRWPNAALVEGCESILDTGGILPRLYMLAAVQREHVAASAGTDRQTMPSPSLIVVVSGAAVADLLEVFGRWDSQLLVTSVIQLDQAPDVVGALVDLETVRKRRSEAASRAGEQARNSPTAAARLGTDPASRRIRR